MFWTFILAAVKSLPQVLKLVNALMAMAEAKRQRGIGYDQAVKEALEEGSEKVRLANDIEAEARKDHATKAGDDAFDMEFMRKDGA